MSYYFSMFFMIHAMMRYMNNIFSEPSIMDEENAFITLTKLLEVFSVQDLVTMLRTIRKCKKKKQKQPKPIQFTQFETD